jgi:hypothetical protein
VKNREKQYKIGLKGRLKVQNALEPAKKELKWS